ncbi:transcriptional repressor [Pseudooceanicola sp. CBS1P-1]|uniref:Transcriptional repressor n=1 Tax=Pseudooceanicola albus TaxID=2692189 RepID=A0A6L7G286_9RHOB|nr:MULTISPECIES: transcriptional repressor [Pseudooceanicola]MBT9384773.1 transcriptional repressor [Pseudooceanicola endophyticus]MXN18474.1 transcriptional repressor [Pseudooceanicola albus]
MELQGFERHDHASCIRDGVDAAAEHCRREGLQLTPVRRRVLEILLERHRALGAYDILDTLRDEGLGSQPPVAYRALDFLVKNGFAHRIERLNAFVACNHPGENHSPAFLICRKCDRVAEGQADPASDMLGRSAAAIGFRIERAVVEAEGLCPACQENDRK